MSGRQPRVVLNLSAGLSSLVNRELTAGIPVAPFSLGSSGDWSIQAPGVAESHLFLAFDGSCLFAAAVSTEHPAYLDGVRIGPDWTPVPVPSSLVFGAASVVVDRENGGHSITPPLCPQPIIDLSRADKQPTQVVDLSSTLRLRTVRLEVSSNMLDALREAPPEQPLAVSRTQTTGSPSIQSGDTLIFQAAPVRTLAFPLPPELRQGPSRADLLNTLHDGGALREFAAKLANAQRREVVPALQSAPEPPKRPGVLQRPLAAFRRSSVPKQITIALLPLAIAGVWAMRGGSASASNAAPATVRVKPRAAAVSAPSAPMAAPALPSPPPAWLGSRAPAPEPITVPAQPGDANERLALIAAFSGNRTEAAALYERLASARKSRTFALAARLSREDRVRKP